MAATAKKTTTTKAPAKKETKQLGCDKCRFHIYIAAANIHTCAAWNRRLDPEEVKRGFCHRAEEAE